MMYPYPTCKTSIRPDPTCTCGYESGQVGYTRGYKYTGTALQWSSVFIIASCWKACQW